ncbi:hypothetical protein SUDANB1_01462 [Streptomyces sp. enrichment culture]|uniref:hypothetical protein n=1 Tax=Streptomyces sp. enrichment culture TaxID=1795815 RepID=UPI003F555473
MSRDAVDHRKPVRRERPASHPGIPEQADQVVRVVDPAAQAVPAPGLTTAPLKDRPNGSAAGQRRGALTAAL